MRKLIVLCLILTPAVWLTATDGPDYFSFDLAVYGGYAGDVTGGNRFGLSYFFNETFSGGFRFYRSGAVNITALEMSVRPAKKVALTMISGDQAGNMIFGAGLSLEFFTKKKTLFTGMAVFLEWLGSNAGVYQTSSGGLVMFGLQTKFGI